MTKHYKIKHLRKHRKKKAVLLTFLFLIFIASVVWATFLSSKIVLKNNEIDSLNEELDKTSSTLKKLNASNNNLQSSFDILNSETQELLQDIEEYETQIEESLEWYQRNSDLDSLEKPWNVKRELEQQCYDVVVDKCFIKLGCLYLVNSEFYSFDYLYDSGDKISSLEEFVNKSGGDCEDYSLFYKAEYNYLLGLCGDKKVVLEAWEDNGGARYWASFKEDWWLQSVKLIDIEDHIYPNIVCGSLYDLNTGEGGGHCMMAFTEKPITKLSELSYLDGAPLIEPQDGSFNGNINNDNSETYLLNETILESGTAYSWIDTIITDEDYYLVSYDTGLWSSYSSFNSDLKSKETKLTNYLDFFEVNL